MRWTTIGFCTALFILLFLSGCTLLATQEKTDTGTKYVIRYYSEDSSGQKTVVVTNATRQSDGSFKLDNGQTLEKDSQVEIVTTLSGASPVCQCTCDCCPEGEQPCVEPTPRERYLCADGQVVKDKGECEPGMCNYTVVKKIFLCPDGTEVDDPERCGGVVKTLFYCSDGRLVATKEECTCPQVATHAVNCSTIIIGMRYECVDGRIVSTPDGCGGGEATTIYVCSDGRRVKEEADCSAPCPQPTYNTLAVSANIPSNAVRIVYECWNGLIVNSRADCPLYCERECVCPDYEKPVCGGDGRTYRNRCYAGCAGVVVLTDGECPEYECLERGRTCRPVGLYAVSSLSIDRNLTNITGCCPGTECLPEPGTPSLAAASQVRYICQEPQPGCRKNDDKCVNASDCCSGYCNPNGVCADQPCANPGERCRAQYVTGSAASNITLPCCDGQACGADGYCPEQSSCQEEGETCGGTNNTLAANLPSTNLTCCEGLVCTNGICQKRPTCLGEGAYCGGTTNVTGAVVANTSATCCEGYYCSANGYCAKTCVEDNGKCDFSSDCCSGYCDPQSYTCGVCKGTGRQCNASSECCTNYCSNGYCQEYPSCTQNKYSCGANGDCCSGYCSYQTGVCETPTCTETDAGEDYATAGTTTGKYGTKYNSYTDYCLDTTTLAEYYCSGDLVYKSEVTCPNGGYCRAGACVATTTTTCTDSDAMGAADPYNVKGTVNETEYSGTTVVHSITYPDYCENSQQLREYYCDDSNHAAYETIDCDYGCANGVCLSCLADGSTCASSSACCSQYCGQGICQSEPTCTAAGNACARNAECCTNYCSPNGYCTCQYEYCTAGIFYTSCYYDTMTEACVCSQTTCRSGACNEEGTGCLPSLA